LNEELRAARAGSSSAGSSSGSSEEEEVRVTVDEAKGEFEVDLKDIVVEKDLSLTEEDLAKYPDLTIS
jgi:hypothetical protein